MTVPEATFANTPLAPEPTPLSRWPESAALGDVDLSLEGRNRFSALAWRGQFSPMTVERLIGALAPADARILDPFVGSGTTLLEAASLGHPSVGLDVNPAAVALANCASLSSLPPEIRESRLREANAEAPRAHSEAGGTITLAHALRLLANGSSATDALAQLRSLVSSLPSEPVETEVHLGDARATGLQAGSFQFALTSPPYINVFNYHQHGRPLTDSFGWPILEAARSEIGSNRQNRQNRFKTVLQYAIDMALALGELCRLLETGSTAVLVLGRESRVRGTAFLNGEIVGEIAWRLGLFDQYERSERRFTNRYGQTIFEDVLVLRGSASETATEAQATDTGRAVGLAALDQADRSPETADEIQAAIEAAPDVQASPLAGSDLCPI